jgi:hypothetical protein
MPKSGRSEATGLNRHDEASKLEQNVASSARQCQAKAIALDDRHHPALQVPQIYMLVPESELPTGNHRLTLAEMDCRRYWKDAGLSPPRYVTAVLPAPLTCPNYAALRNEYLDLKEVLETWQPVVRARRAGKLSLSFLVGGWMQA